MKLNKEDLIKALLEADVSDEDIRKAREKKKSDDKVRLERARKIASQRKAVIDALADYLHTLNPDSKEVDWKNFEDTLKEVEKAAETGAKVSINLAEQKDGEDILSWDDFFDKAFRHVNW